MKILEWFKGVLLKVFFKKEQVAQKEATAKILAENRELSHQKAFITQQLMGVEGELAITAANLHNSRVELENLKKLGPPAKAPKKKEPVSIIDSEESVPKEEPQVKVMAHAVFPPPDAPAPTAPTLTPNEAGLHPVPEPQPDLEATRRSVEPPASSSVSGLKICSHPECDEIASSNYPEYAAEPWDFDLCPKHARKPKPPEKLQEKGKVAPRGKRGRKGKRGKKRGK